MADSFANVVYAIEAKLRRLLEMNQTIRSGNDELDFA